MKPTTLRWLFLAVLILQFVSSAFAHYDPRLGRFLSRDPLREEGGFNLYAYCGNDPVNRHDPLGLDWKVSNGRLYWGEDQQVYNGSSMGTQHVYRDLGALAGGYSLTSNQLNSVQGIFRGLVDCLGKGQSTGVAANEDILKTLMLLQGFFPEKVNQLHGEIDPRWVVQGVEAARTLANPNSLIVGPNIGQVDVDPILAYSNLGFANPLNAFSRAHPIFSRIATEASVVGPYAAIGLAQVPGVSTSTAVAPETVAVGGLLPAQGGPGAQLLSEYRYFRGQGFTPAQARYLTEPYVGDGHHFIPRRAPLPDLIIENPANIAGRGMSRGRFYERHYAADPYFHGAAFPKRIGGSWSGKAIGLTKPGRPVNWWFAAPDWLRAAGVGGAAAGSAGAIYWYLDDE